MIMADGHVHPLGIVQYSGVKKNELEMVDIPFYSRGGGSSLLTFCLVFELYKKKPFLCYPRYQPLVIYGITTWTLITID